MPALKGPQGFDWGTFVQVAQQEAGSRGGSHRALRLTRRASFHAEAGTTHTRAIAKPNPALFDSRQPRTAVQLIVIGLVRYNMELFTKVQEQTDVAALAKMIE